MARYLINDLEKLTGVKAHTIRIWEKRYNIIAPHRTSTNIRYYDDEQVRRLLNVTTLVGFGHKISRVASLTDAQLNEAVAALQASPSDDVVKSSFITELTSAMLSYDEDKFEKLLGSVITRYGMYTAMTTVIYPFLVNTGVLWSVNEVMPSQEHFASMIVRRKLAAAIDGLPPAHKSEKSVLLFLPQDEWHEIGLLLSEYIVRSHGYKATYLGQCVPFGNVKEIISHVKPTHLVTFFFMEKKKIDLITEYYRLASEYPMIKLAVCGRKEMLFKLKTASNMVLITSPAEMNEMLTTSE